MLATAPLRICLAQAFRFIIYRFWLSIAHPLPPVKLMTTNIPTDGYVFYVFCTLDYLCKYTKDANI